MLNKPSVLRKHMQIEMTLLNIFTNSTAMHLTSFEESSAIGKHTQLFPGEYKKVMHTAGAFDLDEACYL